MTDQSYSFRLPGFSSALPFLAAILGFFLVFTEVDCNGTTMISMTGYDLVTGDRQDPDTGTKEQEDPNIWAIISWVLQPRTDPVRHYQTAFSLVVDGCDGIDRTPGHVAVTS